MKKNIAVVFLLFFYLLQAAYGQQGYRNHLVKSEMEADMDILKFQLEHVHAGLYEYGSKEKLDATFLEIRNSLKDSMTDLDFYRALAPLQEIIKNGHTMVIPSEKWSNYKVEQLPLFPFEVYWDEGQLYILTNLSDDVSIENGAAVLSINGTPTKKVVDRLLASITRDGDNTTYPLHLMSLGFEHWYADIIGTPSHYVLDIRPLGNRDSYHTKVRALKEFQINKNHLKRYNQKRMAWFLRPNEDKLNLKIDGKIATIRVPTFDSDEKSARGEKYSRFYKKAFLQIKKAAIEYLILDLRNNGGGDPRPQLALLSHLLDEPIQLYKSTFTVMKKVPNPELYPNDKVKRLNRLANLILEKKGAVYEVKNNIFTRMEGGPPKRPVQPKDNLFRGKLYILIDGGSFSATGETAGILKDRKRGVFIGEEAGGSDFQNTSGRMPILSLPNSGVRIRMPLIAYKLNVEGSNDGHGVIPDFQVRNTISQELQGKDAVMQWTLNHIANEENKEEL